MASFVIKVYILNKREEQLENSFIYSAFRFFLSLLKDYVGNIFFPFFFFRMVATVTVNSNTDFSFLRNSAWMGV